MHNKTPSGISGPRVFPDTRVLIKNTAANKFPSTIFPTREMQHKSGWRGKKTLGTKWSKVGANFALIKVLVAFEMWERSCGRSFCVVNLVI